MPAPDQVVGLSRASKHCIWDLVSEPVRLDSVRLVFMKGGYIYIMSNKHDGTLYVGVTSNLSRRIWEHREGIIDGFTKRYGLKRLVYYEPYDDIRNALQREKNLKHWPRLWKLALIHEANPDWEDLTRN